MQTKTRSVLTSRSVVLACLALAAGYFLVMRHWEHIVEFLPYAILLACPLMHLFGGHGAHAGHADHADHAHAATEE